jgi:hypothetical protein
MKPHRNLVPAAAAMTAFVLLPLTAPRLHAQAGEGRAITVNDRVGVTGIGPVQVGMTVMQAIDATDSPWVVGESLDGGSCRHGRPEKGPKGLAFMFVSGRVARVEVDEPGILTSAGAQVGDTVARIRALYPGLKTEPHEYENGQYLIITPKDAKQKKYRLIFETNGKTITRYRAGALPAVAWVEGCA